MFHPFLLKASPALTHGDPDVIRNVVLNNGSADVVPDIVVLVVRVASSQAMRPVPDDRPLTAVPVR